MNDKDLEIQPFKGYQDFPTSEIKNLYKTRKN